MNATKQLLDGVRVADFSRVLAGPYATAMLADQGAEVFKIEMPGHGDDSRHLGPFTDTGSTYFTSLNRGKRSIEADLKDPEQHAQLLDFIRTCDVVVENFRPGVAAKLGLSFEDIKAVKPDIVYASISGFGQTGTQAKRPAYDTVIQALSGLMSSTGFPDGSPTRVGESIADVSAGVFAAFGVSSALFHRQTTGEGCPHRHPDARRHACHAADEHGHPCRRVDTESCGQPAPDLRTLRHLCCCRRSRRHRRRQRQTLRRPLSHARQALSSSSTRVSPPIPTVRTTMRPCAPRSRSSPPATRWTSCARSSTRQEFPTLPSSTSPRRSTDRSPTVADSPLPIPAPVIPTWRHPLLVNGVRPTSALPVPHLGEHNDS